MKLLKVFFLVVWMAGCTGSEKPFEEWQRTHPDVAVYLPQSHADAGNESIMTIQSPRSGDLLAFWRQCISEGTPDSHIVYARSSDGKTWSKPETLAGIEVKGYYLFFASIKNRKKGDCTPFLDLAKQLLVERMEAADRKPARK
jgi:hypothetical protein